MSMMSAKRQCPEQIASRARGNGYESGKHEERDRQIGVTKYSPKILAEQDAVLHIYAVWNWNRTDPRDSFDECRKRVLCVGSNAPDIFELKDFWRFYKDQSTGNLGKHASVVSLLARAKQFNAGYKRVTGTGIENETVAEINHWLRRVLPLEEGSGVKNITKPKYNYKPADLERNLKALWQCKGHDFVHPRTLFQFHFLLLLFCHSGARISALLKPGVKYKDIQLVLRRTPKGDPELFFKVDQRHVKNNPDPENTKFGVTGREHHLLRYNAVFFLLQLAFVDGALDCELFLKIMRGKGDGPIPWHDAWQDVPVCRAVDRQGVLHPTKAMGEGAFMGIFKRLLGSEYSYDTVSMHAIRRELGKQLDERYTETERSQHILHKDNKIFGTSYVAFVSSCDGFAAFMRESPDHSVIDYFQGLGQFWQPNLPTSLPASLERKVLEHPEIAACDRQIQNAVDEEARAKAMTARQNTIKRHRRSALKRHRVEAMEAKQHERLLHGVPSDVDDDYDSLDDLIPEKSRLARAMDGTSALSCDEQLRYMRDALFLLENDWSVYYRPGEEPEKGTCRFCHKALASIKKRDRCNHVHRCRKSATAKLLGVLQSEVEFCYFCMEFFRADEWQEHCRHHLSTVKKRCGAITYQHTLIRPAFCPLCMQAEDARPSVRLQYWERDADARKHVELCHGWKWTCRACDFVADGPESGYSHLHDVHHYNIPKLNLVTKTRPSTVPESEALLDPATGSVSKAVGSDVESWDQTMIDLSSLPSTPPSGATSSPKHSRNTTSNCLAPSVLMQCPDAAADAPNMSTQLVERTTSPNECPTPLQTIDSFIPGEEHLHRRCDSISLGATDCGSETAWPDLGDSSRPSSPATGESPRTPPMESATDFASYASDALFVLDAMDATMTDDDGDCGTPLPSSPKTLHSGLSPSTPVIASAIADEELNGLAPEAPPVCALHDELKRPRIKLRVRPTSGGAPCSVTSRPQSVLSPSTATARPRVRITLKTGSVKRRMALCQDAGYKEDEGQSHKKRRILLRTR
ncbi:hypothetical protein JDV02_003162 [Purpureocillium takamizusanense]|uniref:Uncharacterized protein n=1 Tax=Purpureocillium takamizusanense TaxID=2060973 RepID=A0A9Q8QD35_9HYPO|nr:uncharacterized protein JDV02_003162 [Purpureocillium takamizusanense]UNI16754.1 hypothetical protein JDV02_003162 [Purpureocillium takamizusanense]